MRKAVHPFIGFRVPRDLKRAAERIARRRGETLSTLLRRLLADLVAHELAGGRES